MRAWQKASEWKMKMADFEIRGAVRTPYVETKCINKEWKQRQSAYDEVQTKESVNQGIPAPHNSVVHDTYLAVDCYSTVE
jgi:hypothetical protein